MLTEKESTKLLANMILFITKMKKVDGLQDVKRKWVNKLKTTPQQWLAMSDEVKQAELNKRARGVK
ncbi:hypothetical protein [Lysinibacillus sp. GbtcB16]|uniref:hypothetical protein n=1 Tax=Lysinibacillus sp. GbtcB16 TaxID=2824761 RepID=UPI001C2F4961|nr:hypothetical protein [Lysinibacillus sp. GbtcB16]